MNIPYKLIANVLDGAASKKEKEQLALWRSSSVENEFIYSTLKNERVFTQKENREFVVPDKEKVWNELMQKLPVRKTVAAYSLKQMIAVAAMVAVVFLTAGYAMSAIITDDDKYADIYTTIIAPEGQKTKTILPDGTEVWLNSGSSITYSGSFAEDNRNISMAGEAYFEVTKNREMPFNLNIEDEVSLTVLGTSFNVKNNKQTIEVALNRGSVKLVDQDSNESLAILNNMEKAIIEKRNDELYCLVTKITDYNYNIWSLDELKFENASFDEIIRKLEIRYGMTISYSNINTDERYWMIIQNESLDEILQVLRKIVPITYSINDKHVIIEGK